MGALTLKDEGTPVSTRDSMVTPPSARQVTPTLIVPSSP